MLTRSHTSSRPARRWAAALLATAVLAVPLALAPQPAVADPVIDIEGNDREAPVVVSVTAESQTVDVSQSSAYIPLTATATDDLSGVAWISVGFHLADGPWIYDNLTLTAGTQLDGMWSGGVTMPRWTPSGHYVLGCFAGDTVGHLTEACPVQTEVAIEVVGGDTTKPAISEITVPATEVSSVEGPTEIPVSMRVTDALSGASSAFLTFAVNSGSLSLGVNLTRTSGTPQDGIWSGTVVVPHHAPTGVYRISCDATDAAGNQELVCPASSSLTITGDDVEPPGLHSLEMTPLRVNVLTTSATVHVSARATDDRSGVRTVMVHLTNAAHNVTYRAQLQRAAGTALDGVWTGDLVVPAHAPAGSYGVICQVWDLVDRKATTCPAGTREVDVAQDPEDPDPEDPDPEDPDPEDPDPVTADLRVSDLNHTPQSAQRGQTVTLSATVTNDGPDSPADASVTFLVPGGTSYVSGSDGCTSLPLSSTVRCALPAGQLAPGQSLTRAITVAVHGDAPNQLSSSATVGHSGIDPAPHNSLTDDIQVEQVDPGPERVALEIDKSIDVTTADAGDLVHYTLTAKNWGPGAAAATRIVDTLPDQVSLVSYDAPDDALCAFEFNTLVCEVGSVPANASRTVVITARVDADAGDPDVTAGHVSSAHHLDVTKVETHLDIPAGQTASASATCPTGTVATDGSVRLDHVDQGTGTIADLNVTTSGATPDGTGWTGTVHNPATGRAQAKVAATCMSTATSFGEGDVHHVTVSAPVVSVRTVEPGYVPVLVSCPAGSTAIAPSWSFTGDGVDVRTSVDNYSGGSLNHVWRLVLEVYRTTVVTTSVRCLSPVTTRAHGHVHDLALVESPYQSVPAAGRGQFTEAVVTCQDDEKAILASWSTSPDAVFAGQDPRGKAAALRFYNPSGGSLPGFARTLCIGDRTEPEPVPNPVTNTATVSTTSPDTTPDDDRDSVTFSVNPTETVDPLAPTGSTGFIGPVLPIDLAGPDAGPELLIAAGPATLSTRAGRTSVTVQVQGTSGGPVTAELIAIHRVRSTSIRRQSVLARLRTTLPTDGVSALRLRPKRVAAVALRAGRITRARLVVTSADGTQVVRVVRLRR